MVTKKSRRSRALTDSDAEHVVALTDAERVLVLDVRNTALRLSSLKAAKGRKIDMPGLIAAEVVSLHARLGIPENRDLDIAVTRIFEEVVARTHFDEEAAA